MLIAPRITYAEAVISFTFRRRNSGKRKSHCLEQVFALASKLGLEIIKEKQSSHSAPQAASRDLFVKYVRHVADVVAIKYGARIDRTLFDDELEDWCSTPNSWGTLTGGSWLILQKN